jgi:hypothetical protein
VRTSSHATCSAVARTVRAARRFATASSIEYRFWKPSNGIHVAVGPACQDQGSGAETPDAPNTKLRSRLG